MLRPAPAFIAMLISVVPAASALAQPTFTATTRCSMLLRVVGIADQSAIRAARSYIEDVMEQHDAQVVARGQGGIMERLDANERLSLVLVVATFCDRDPQRTVRSAALEAYDEALATHDQMERPR